MKIIGHEKILDFLRGSITGAHLAHGYLFCGPAGVGKLALARWFAAELLGIKDEAGLGAHPDVFFVSREIDEKTKKLKKNISVEQVRDAIYRLTLSSFFDSWKIAVIDDADTLSLEAANSLLKTLEEPRCKVIVILISVSREALPTTVVSRLQVINFRPVPESRILTGLLDRGLPRAQAAEIAKIADGKPGRALDFLSDGEAVGVYKERAEWLLKILKSNIAARFKLIEDGVADFNKEEAVREALGVLDIWSGVTRDLLLTALGNNSEIINVFLSDQLPAAAQKFGGKTLLIKRGLDEARALIAANVNYELAFKNIFLKI